ncbi:MFS4B-like protein [Mya arenaria]|uniref:MFS4B-like protein n=1 Tax=Mya arenaria TaxID=6604 RepID=A0ABY7DJ15_MYAAR|nr:MFS4B-like protein [Mya arenaria]WAQ96908.1 MFS4B-like protein [Mya arenaria]
MEGKDGRSFVGKILETACLIVTWMALALYVEIYGPTLIDLKDRLHTDYEKVAVAISGRSVGWFPGAVVGGVLVDRFPGYCHLMLAVVLDVAAGVTAAIPMSPSVTCLWVFCFIGAGTRILFNMWKEKSVSPLMLVHLGYGIGSFIVPLYANPFLADTAGDADYGNDTLYNNGTVEGNGAIKNNGTISNTSLSVSRIEYPYGISAAFAACLSLVFYAYQVREWKMIPPMMEHTVENEIETTNTISTEEEKGKSLLEMVNPASCAGGHFWYGVQIFSLVFLYFGNIGGGDRMIGSFIRSYSIDQLKFTKDSATLLNTGYWISFSVGRLVFSFFARILSVRLLILVETAGMAVSSVILVLLADDDSLSLWVAMLAFAFFASASWPTGIAWIDYHIVLTGLGLTLQTFGASVGGICHMRLIGYLYKNFGPKTFLYQALGYGVLQFTLAVAMNIVGSQHGSRYEKNKNDVSIQVNEEYEDDKLSTKM